MSRPSHRHEPPASLETERDDERIEILVFDRETVRAVDRAAIDEFGIPGLVLMENAARGLADHAMLMLVTESHAPISSLIICGSGNNGGDGYALARHQYNRGVNVTIAALGAPKAETDAGINRSICERMNLRLIDATRLDETIKPREYALIVDAIFGTGLDRDVTGDAAKVIEWINAAQRPVLAVDVPSGMDCNTGRRLGACVEAHATVTFVGMKAGFLGLDAQKLLGEVVIADIGAPRELIERLGKRVRLPRRAEATERMAAPESSVARRRI